MQTETEPRVMPRLDTEPEARPLVTVQQTTPHPLALVQMAIERGADPDKLTKLVDLAERMDARRAEQAFTAAMVRVQQAIAKLPPIINTTKGQHSKYSELETIQARIEPIYLAEGFAPSFTTRESKLPNYICVVLLLMHQEGHTREYPMDLPVDGAGAKGGNTAMNAVQGHGSTFSYGQRYTLVKAFNVKLIGEDNDGVLFGALIGEKECLILQELIEETRTEFGLVTDYASQLAKRPIGKLDEIPWIVYDKVKSRLNSTKVAKQKEAADKAKAGGK